MLNLFYHLFLNILVTSGLYRSQLMIDIYQLFELVSSLGLSCEITHKFIYDKEPNRLFLILLSFQSCLICRGPSFMPEVSDELRASDTSLTQDMPSLKTLEGDIKKISLPLSFVLVIIMSKLIFTRTLNAFTAVRLLVGKQVYHIK